ncbi:MAG: 4-hydroxybenzoate octaprenyltransferase [Ahrensia sp.]|nr:4-hydroxybenzoate octaprenyltransferase [Ahrensia sp.]
MDALAAAGYPRLMMKDAPKVADALADSWVYRLLPTGLWPYAQLARWERPIGWWLLLWPCWWSLALAVHAANAQGVVKLSLSEFVLLCILFLLGAASMRGAGCTYNDLVDVDLDAKVTRTASRPIPSGRVSKAQAAQFMVAQALAGFLVLLALCLIGPGFNLFAFVLAIASLLVVALYPFAKRVMDWPQLVLGLAFSWGALMGWAVVFERLHAAPLLLYLGSILWVIGYDTIYAHQDREDDALIGVRSTARLFGERTKQALWLLYCGTLALFVLAFLAASSGPIAYAGLLIGAGHMMWQIKKLNIHDADTCLRLFRSNSTFGWIVFAGLVADLLL